MRKNVSFILVTYYDRSGSSFLLNKLSEYKDVFVFPEGEILVNIFLRTNRIWKKIELERLFREDRKLKKWGVEIENLESVQKDIDNGSSGLEIFFSILFHLKEKKNPEASVIVFKAYELSLLKLSLLKERTGLEILIIFLIRDGRACYRSIRENLKCGRRQAGSPEYHAIKWKSFVKKAINEAGESIIIIKYENLVLGLEDYLKKIFRLIGKNQMKDRGVKNAYYHQLDRREKRIHKNIIYSAILDNVNRWKEELGTYEIAVFQKFAGDVIEAMGYEMLDVSFHGEKRIFLFFRRAYSFLKVIQHRYFWKREIFLKYRRRMS